MAKKYTITVEDYRGYYHDPSQAFVIRSMVNTVAFRIGETISQKDLARIIDDENATVKITARS